MLTEQTIEGAVLWAGRVVRVGMTVKDTSGIIRLLVPSVKCYVVLCSLRQGLALLSPTPYPFLSCRGHVRRLSALIIKCHGVTGAVNSGFPPGVAMVSIGVAMVSHHCCCFTRLVKPLGFLKRLWV